MPNATVKIDVGHLHGGKATILDTVPVTGTVSPYVEGQHVEVSFYLNGKQVLNRQVAIQQGPNETGTFESSVVRQGRRQVRGLGQARGDRRTWAPTRPCARAGR